VRFAVAVIVGAPGALLFAAPASAHSADVPAASDYRCTVTGIDPPLAGLSVRAVDAGTQLELINHTGRAIEVLGYGGEPYLTVAPDGVYQNANSPAAYLNETLTGGAAPPSTATVAAVPAWQKLSSTPAVLWHDHRAHWMSSSLPPSVASSPDPPHAVATWSVSLRDGVRTFAVTGRLDWVPRPAPAAWWAGALLLGAAVAGLGFRRLRAADLALGLSGACLALFAGAANAALFAHPIPPVPFAGGLARTLVLLCIGGGAGLAGVTALWMRRPAVPVAR
jgi:hypothetical protein